VRRSHLHELRMRREPMRERNTRYGSFQTTPLPELDVSSQRSDHRLHHALRKSVFQSESGARPGRTWEDVSISSCVFEFSVQDDMLPCRKVLCEKSGDNLCARAIRLNNQLSAKVTQALSHSTDSDSRALGLDLSQLFRRHSATLIPNLDDDRIGFASNADGCALTSRVTMHVRQGLLHDTKND